MNSKFFPSPRGTTIAISLLGLTIAGSGCSHRPIIIQTPAPTVIQSQAPASASASAPAVIVMKDAPPPPRFEQATPQPSGDSVWIPGYWYYRDGEQQWVVGHWDVPPRVGATWIPPRWEKQGDSYLFTQGYWQ